MPDALYRSIAVASTFSPRFLRVISEAKRVRDRFDSRLSLIYVGEPDTETVQKFMDALAELELPADSPVHYQRGADPAEAILEAARANDVDLIVAGALEKEAILRPFLGDVPVLGYLFKTTSRTSEKQELLIFLTPRVIRESINAIK